MLVAVRKLCEAMALTWRRILDAMMQFAQNQLLQLVRGLALLGVDPGLRKQGFGVDAGLFQQQAKTVILRRQHRLMGGAGRRIDCPARVNLIPLRYGAPGKIFNAPAPIIAFNSAIICSTPSGLPKKRLSAGLSASDGFTRPDTRKS